jgi:hypothetical protein
MWILCNSNGDLLTIPAVMRGEKLHRFVLANSVGSIEPIGYLKKTEKTHTQIVAEMTTNSCLSDSKMLSELRDRVNDLVATINSEWFAVDVKRRFGIDIYEGMPWSVTIAPNCIVLEVRKKFKGNSIIAIGENAEAIHKKNELAVNTSKKIGRPAQKLIMLAPKSLRDDKPRATVGQRSPIAEKIGNMVIHFLAEKENTGTNKNLTNLITNAKTMLTKSRKEINNIRSGK